MDFNESFTRAFQRLHSSLIEALDTHHRVASAGGLLVLLKLRQVLAQRCDLARGSPASALGVTAGSSRVRLISLFTSYRQAVSEPALFRRKGTGRTSANQVWPHVYLLWQMFVHGLIISKSEEKPNEKM